MLSHYNSNTSKINATQDNGKSKKYSHRRDTHEECSRVEKLHMTTGTAIKNKIKRKRKLLFFFQVNNSLKYKYQVLKYSAKKDNKSQQGYCVQINKSDNVIGMFFLCFFWLKSWYRCLVTCTPWKQLCWDDKNTVRLRQNMSLQWLLQNAY